MNALLNAGYLVSFGVRRALFPIVLSACFILPILAFAQGSSTDYQTLWKRGEYHKAQQALESLIERHGPPLPLLWRVDRAKLLKETGHIDEAIAELERLERDYLPSDDLLYLALLYRERGMDEEYQRTLGRVTEQVRRAMSYRPTADLLLLQGRLLELEGYNPKTILNQVYALLMERFPDFAPGFVAAGDLALGKWDYQLAAEYYRKALEADHTNREALAGLAECYWKSNNSRVDEILQSLLAMNPNHPRALAIQVEIALDVGNTEKAQELIEQSLTINPQDQRMLALQAATYFLEDNLTSMTAVQKKGLELNPNASQLYRIPARIISRHYRFEEGAEMHRQALEVNPDDHRARAYYGLDLMRLGRETEGRKQLEQAFEADPYNVVVYNMLQLLDTFERFETVERESFIFQLPRDEAPILAGDALAMLDEAYRLYTNKYDVELETPIRVQMFDNHDDFMVRSVGLPGSIGHLGICFGRLVTMDSPSARTKWESNWKSVLWHEFVHVITLQKTSNRLPRWLSEGISVYEQTQRDSSWAQPLSVQYKAIIEHEPLPEMSDLERFFTQPDSAMHLMFGYMASGEFVKFYVDAYGFNALNQTLDFIKDGEEAIDALAIAANVSRNELNEGFNRYLHERLAAYENLPSAPSPKQLAGESDDSRTTVTLERILTRAEARPSTSPFGEAMQTAQEALESNDYETAEAALKRAYELFPHYMGPDAPLRQLIALYEKQNRRDDLIQTLRRQIAFNETDFASRRKLVELMRDKLRWDEMLPVAESALNIDPFDVEMRRTALTGYFKTGRVEKALEMLDVMPLIDPAHEADYRVMKIETLCDLRRWEEARNAAMRLLEEMPYYEEAQRLLLKIEERESTGGFGGTLNKFSSANTTP